MPTNTSKRYRELLVLTVIDRLVMIEAALSLYYGADKNISEFQSAKELQLPTLIVIAKSKNQ